jgi:hypothetical protein
LLPQGKGIAKERLLIQTKLFSYYPPILLAATEARPARRSLPSLKTKKPDSSAKGKLRVYLKFVKR